MQTTAISQLLAGITSGKILFADVIRFIDNNYHYRPVDFSNGEISNAAGTNEGSAKVFGFAKLHGLNAIDTLTLFAEHYRAVLASPEGTDHANIRNFMYYGWQGISMPINALKLKS